MMNKVILCCCLLLLLLSDVFAATYHVTRFNDPQVNTPCSEFDCSLRQAVIAANNNPGADEIVLLLTEYVLFQAGDDDTAEVGDLDVTGDLTLTGVFESNVPLTMTSVITHADFDDRIFDVHPGAQFTVNNVFVHGGYQPLSNGGGIRVVDAALNLTNVYVANNKAVNGSGIFAHNSQLQLNHVHILVNQNLAVTDYGGGLFMYGGSLVASHSKFSENFADLGGAIAAVNFSDLSQHPAITIKHSHFFDNGADKGAAIYLDGGSDDGLLKNVVIEHSQIQSNDATQGGGIYHLASDLSLHAVTMNRNSATGIEGLARAGGAIYSGDGRDQENTARLTISHSVFFDHNAVDQGGVIFFDDDQLNIKNSTFSQNEAGQYAAMFVQAGEVLLQHNSILLNESSNGEDLFFGSGVDAVLQNNIFMARCTTLFFAELVSLGGNIESPGDTCGLDASTHDLFGTLLRGLLSMELQDNGGPTVTHAITGGHSQAINHGSHVADLPHDQRFFVRDGHPDSGAYEWQSNGVDLIFSHGLEAGL